MSDTTYTPHEEAAYISGFNAAIHNKACVDQYYPEGDLRDAYVTGYDRGTEVLQMDDEPTTNEDSMTYEYNDMERRAFGSGYHHGASGDLPYNIYAVGSTAYDAYAQGYDEGTENYEDTYAPVPVAQAEDFFPADLTRYQQNAWKVGYHHGLTGSDAYNNYIIGTMAHTLYDEGYEAGAKEYNSDEDFPEHEGLDNQDYARAADMFADTPDEVILDDDEVAARVAERWNLNDFQWDDDSSPIVAIQIKDGGVWEAFATAPVRLYIMDEDTPDAEVPDGLTLDEQGTLTYASKWARGNVQFEN